VFAKLGLPHLFTSVDHAWGQPTDLTRTTANEKLDPHHVGHDSGEDTEVLFDHVIRYRYDRLGLFRLGATSLQRRDAAESLVHRDLN
jgi:hypothetical protein